MNGKDFTTLAAKFALQGNQLSRFTDDADDRVTYIVSRGGMFHTFTTLDACRAWYAAGGGLK